MNGPSSNALNNIITWISWNPLPQDADGGARTDASSYTKTIVANIPCGCHLTGSVEVEGPDNRPSIMNTWAISMGQFVALKLKDKGVFVLNGQTHEVFVMAFIDRAGRSKAYKIMCAEKL